MRIFSMPTIKDMMRTLVFYWLLVSLLSFVFQTGSHNSTLIESLIVGLFLSTITGIPMILLSFYINHVLWRVDRPVPLVRAAAASILSAEIFMFIIFLCDFLLDDSSFTLESFKTGNIEIANGMHIPLYAALAMTIFFSFILFPAILAAICTASIALNSCIIKRTFNKRYL